MLVDSVESKSYAEGIGLMRRFPPLIALAILFILAAVASTYYARLRQMAATAPKPPRKLPVGTQGVAQDWHYTETHDGRKIVFVRAKDFQQVENKILLTGVELHIFSKDAKTYDDVKSASAEFNKKGNELYSDGAVDIVMDVPANQPDNQPPSGRLMSIHTSGVHFNSKTGVASTDRAATFSFDRGDGQCVGAEYDPNTRQLHMKSAAQLVWRGTDPNGTPMKIETADLVYKELDSKVYLSPWSKLTRGPLNMTAGPATVSLNKGIIQHVETTQAQGSDNQEKRKLTYSADNLAIDFDDHNQVRKITGTQNAHLISTAASGQTLLTTDRVDMDFDTSTKESVLTTAVASGHSVAESRPAWRSGGTPAARVLKSDVITTKMRPGGEEIESVETGGPGTLEFVPSSPDQPHRWMNGDHIWIAYGDNNQIQTVRSVNVSTRTEKPKPANAKKPPAPSLTWSREMLVRFQPNSSQIETLEQTHDFRYEEGDRKAKADRAVLDQPKNIITLIGGARVWDGAGSADAERIVLNQKNGDFTADGNVRSVRLPDQSKDQTPGMLSQSEPLHGLAKHMESTDSNSKIVYDGNVVLWQGANRLTADKVEIDRDDDILKAHGNVVSQLMDQKDNDAKTSNQKTAAKAPKNAAAPLFSVVRAPELVYSDDDKVAYYKGGVQLDRGPTRMKSRELKAFLRDNDDKKGSDNSSLDHAIADGAVVIVSTAPDRTRTGTSEHAEYYVDQNKVILEGGQPKFVDSLRGVTQGKQLIWYSNDDRLLVNGAVGQPAQSHLRKHN